MLDYKKAWKELHNKKTASSMNMVQYLAVKTIKAKTENKEELFRILLKKAFSPTLGGSYDALVRAIRDSSFQYNRMKYFLGENNITDFLNEDEVKLFCELVGLFNYKAVKDTNKYTYIFVRQDIFPEYQLVQAAHVACVLGSKLDGTNPANLYFVVVGVEGLEALENTKTFLNNFGYRYEEFIEPDIGDEATAIATHPIEGDKRGRFKKYKLLKF